MQRATWCAERELTTQTPFSSSGELSQTGLASARTAPAKNPCTFRAGDGAKEEEETLLLEGLVWPEGCYAKYMPLVAKETATVGALTLAGALVLLVLVLSLPCSYTLMIGWKNF